jgi:hypothetical protein
MFFRGYTLRYAAVLFLLILFLLVAGLLVYTVWFMPPQDPPRRSRPVAVSLIQKPEPEKRSNIHNVREVFE